LHELNAIDDRSRRLGNSGGAQIEGVARIHFPAGCAFAFLGVRQ
jgi:hypothetical protein